MQQCAVTDRVIDLRDDGPVLVLTQCLTRDFVKCVTGPLAARINSQGLTHAFKVGGDSFFSHFCSVNLILTSKLALDAGRRIHHLTHLQERLCAEMRPATV